MVFTNVSYVKRTARAWKVLKEMTVTARKSNITSFPSLQTGFLATYIFTGKKTKLIYPDCMLILKSKLWDFLTIFEFLPRSFSLKGILVVFAFGAVEGWIRIFQMVQIFQFFDLIYSKSANTNEGSRPCRTTARSVSYWSQFSKKLIFWSIKISIFVQSSSTQRFEKERER